MPNQGMPHKSHTTTLRSGAESSDLDFPLPQILCVLFEVCQREVVDTFSKIFASHELDAVVKIDLYTPMISNLEEGHIILTENPAVCQRSVVLQILEKKPNLTSLCDIDSACSSRVLDVHGVPLGVVNRFSGSTTGITSRSVHRREHSDGRRV